MARSLLCLPLCLLLAPSYPQAHVNLPPDTGPLPVREAPPWTAALLALGCAPQADFPGNLPWIHLYQLHRRQAAASQGTALVASAPGAGFPGAAPWPALAVLRGVPTQPSPEQDPIAFLEKCLERYDQHIHAYSMTFRKQENIGGTLHPLEIVEVRYRDRPYSVYFEWKEGARKAQRALYVEGENDNQILVLPAGALAAVGVVARDPNGTEAKQSGRYPMNKFGLRQAMERVIEGWKAARAEGALHVEYEGLFKVPETGDRLCYKLHRTRYARPENDGVTDVTVYIDRETLLQVGSVVRGKEGQLLGEYYFRDIRINPPFRPEQFTRAAVKK